MTLHITDNSDKRFLGLVEKVSSLIDNARGHVRTIVNTTMVYTNYAIGHYIVEYEQGGYDRAAYGKRVVERLSKVLTDKYGAGWSEEQLVLDRKFYLVYSNSVNTVYEIDEKVDVESVEGVIMPTAEAIASAKSKDIAPKFSPSLSWSHYLVLMRIKDLAERRFYEIECERQQWSVRQLQRQYNSSLYERLALSRDKAEAMRLANEGHTIESPNDIIKNPITLEFLGLRPESAYSESTLESRIIDKMNRFLLEMGKGFLFEARQKRFTFNEDHYYVDLVLYNRLLQAFVLIDFKVDKLTHQDLGQMQMYVNYYDRYVKLPAEKPTIGILLCKEKNDALVELTLPANANIYAAEYALYLPDKQLLQTKLKEWLDEEEGQ